MKDSEFIELLNLYLDHEISAEDAVRIEAEVQQSLARRRTYQEYCRLQKACTLLAKDYVEQAAATGSSEDRKVVAFETSRSWGASVFVGGLGVAAACVAFVLLTRSNDVAPLPTATNAAVAVSPATAMPVETKTQSTAAREMTQLAVQMTPASRSELQPVFTPATLSLSNRNAGATVAQGDAHSFGTQLDWIKDLQIPPIQLTPAGQLRFDTKTDFKGTPRTFGPGSQSTDVQNAAFKFQR
jgi:hypothetical protein